MFYSAKEIESNIDDVMATLLVHLKKGGYVVIADINVKNILKNALNYDFKDYHILEICKPTAAKEIIGKDDLNGLFVPCKMIIYQEGKITKIRVLSVTQVTDYVYPEASNQIRKYEEEVFSLLDSFAI